MSSTPRPPRAALVVAVAGALCAGTASADPAPPFAQLLERAQTLSPRLAEGRAEILQAQGLARQAGLRPNPTVGLEVENFGGKGPFEGADAAEVTASVTQPLELGGKRPARTASGRAEVEAVRARVDKARAEFAFDLAIAYAEAEAADLRLNLAQEAVSLADDDLRMIQTLVRSGREAELRTLQGRAAAEAARAGLSQAKADREAALARLTALAASDPPITSIGRELFAHADLMEPLPDVDPLAAPAYRQAQAEREAAVRRTALERTRARPDVSVSFGVRRLAGEDATALVAGVSTPFPLFDRNQGNVAAAQASATGAEARLETVRLDVQADIASALAKAGSAQARVAVGRKAEDAAVETYRLTRLGYEGGKLPLSEVLNARRSLIEAREQILSARFERLAAEAALARLQGARPFGDHP